MANETFVVEVLSGPDTYPPLTDEEVVGSACPQCGEPLEKGHKVAKVRAFPPPAFRPKIKGIPTASVVQDPPPNPAEIICFAHLSCCYGTNLPDEASVPVPEIKLPDPTVVGEQTEVEEAQAHAKPRPAKKATTQ